MSISHKRVALSSMMALAAITWASGTYAQTSAPAPEGQVPPPTIDSNADGRPDAWDRDANGVPDAWDTDGDGKPDAKDDDGDGKPDGNTDQNKDVKPER
jgi:hypothetical protein